MPLPHLTQKQIGELAAFVAGYISEQRAAFAKKALPIAAAHAKPLQPFFPADVLSQVGVVRGRASEPGFYPQLREMGISNAPAFSQMAGITFQDIVVHAEPLSLPLLFHELVHAVQYKHLGLEEFAERYVRGFLSGGSYEEIPLEKQAYELEGKFVETPTSSFSVEEDVEKRIRLHTL